VAESFALVVLLAVVAYSGVLRADRGPTAPPPSAATGPQPNMVANSFGNAKSLQYAYKARRLTQRCTRVFRRLILLGCKGFRGTRTNS
jgi:hypothetical protein